ncbi:MAG: AcrB/AcrD/AcrF family protein [Calditrichaeota bacterium]|nr:MAG: AcrB/AcrD/AcrF family protein [Calditrichota bacterium]
MYRAIEWFAKNSVTANLMMLFIIIAGFLSIRGVKKEVFPELATDTVTVSVVYRGAAPTEVEEGVCVKIEEAIQDIEGIERIRAQASENIGTVTAEVEHGYDVQKVLDEIKMRVDGIETFPLETEKPVIKEFIVRNQVINIAISGDTDERSLKAIGERMRNELLARPEITQVELANVRPYEISIEVSEVDLRRYGLTFDEVVRAVRRSSLDLPGGSVKTGAGEILIRTKGQAYRGIEFDNILLRTAPDGTRLYLGEVATVIDGFADTDQSARFNGKPTSILQVYRVGEESALEVAGAVQDYLIEARNSVPEGIALTTWQDDTKILKSRLDLLIRNGRVGLLLVFISLALFLRLRLALWVAVGLVISFFGAFWLMPVFDVSINLISLFAFIVVLGIVVDDAIVVGENVYSHLEKGATPLTAAIEGTKEVSIPVTFAILTTVAAFWPLLNVEGTMGKVMGVIPVIVISTLIFSLVEALFILPSHLGHSNFNQAGKSTGLWTRFQSFISDRLQLFIHSTYKPTLKWALEFRYTTLAVGVGTLILTFGLIAGGWVKFIFFPTVDADNVVALLTMPQGTAAEVTAEAIQKLEQSALQLRKDIEQENGIDGPPIFNHILASVGQQPFRVRSSRHGGALDASFSEAHLGEVNIELAPSETRQLSSPEIANRWRELNGPIPDAVELTFTATLMRSGEPVNVQLSGVNYDELTIAADKLKSKLQQYNGVFDISDSYRAGKQEIALQITPAAENLGLSLFDLGNQVRQAFYGAEAQRIQRGRDDIRVMVRYPATERQSLGDLENMRIRTPNGGEIPFSTAAVASLDRGYAAINRTDRQRTISVTADVDLKVAVPNEIIADLRDNYLPKLVANHQTVSYTFEGEQRQQRQTIAGLMRGFLIALIMIYSLLAIPFRSYLQPFIVMSAIPFGIVGAVWGHVIMGMDLTILSAFGIVALTGVVVNDSLIMVDFINRAREKGMPISEAIREAGVSRFRPILLTSLTTFLGLTPLLLERSVQAQFLIPMAVSLGFGVVFGTFITMVIVPTLYYILEDHKILARKLISTSKNSVQKLLTN